MFTVFIRYLLRLVAAVVVLAISSVTAGPAIAKQTAHMTLAAAKRPLTQPVPVVADSAVSALALERFASYDEVQLAKAAHLDPEPVVSPTATPSPTAAPAHVQVKHVAVPIKTVRQAVKVAASPVVKVVHTAVGTTRLAAVLAFARAQIGEAYVLGAAGPNAWDCSGLTMVAFSAAGINIGGHGVNMQYNLAHSKGYLVPWSQRKPGDLVFYGTPGSFSHVAIYSGNGKIIEAANPARPVIERPYWGTPYSQVARFIR